jgi:hypothetical protein
VRSLRHVAVAMALTAFAPAPAILPVLHGFTAPGETVSALSPSQLGLDHSGKRTCFEKDCFDVTTND